MNYLFFFLLSNFNLFDVPQLNRDKSHNTFDLFENPENSLSPTVLKSFQSKFSGVARPSLASLGTNMLSITSHHSNESIHSAISVN